MVAEDRFSWGELMLMANNNKPNELRVRMMMASSHAERVSIVEEAIEYIAKDFGETPHHRCDRDEDALTLDVISVLKAMGFQANHDEDIGGHCDIVVRGKDGFLWVAEAKIHSQYDWLRKGYQQLVTRYSTGVTGQDAGGLIIYVKVANTKRVMDTWVERFSEAVPEAQIRVCEKSPLIYISTADHPRSGLPFKVRHIPISLWHDPKDK